jgi:phage gp36-like protein
VLDGTTPSATFSAAGAAHVLYAKPTDLGVLSIAKSAIKNVEAEDLAAHCLAGTDEADGYLGAGKTLPLTAWSDDLTAKVADLVTFKVMKQRGFQPEGTDELIVKGRDDAVSWLKGVARGDIEPPGMIDSTPETYEAGIVVYSDAPQNSGGQFWP